MANFTVPTSPPGVWPVETASIDTVVYGRVEADVLRRKTGQIAEDRDARAEADMVEKATHTAPRITSALEDTVVADNDTNVTFEVEFEGDPTPEVHWYRTLGATGNRVELLDADAGLSIATDTDSSLLTLAEVDIAVDDEALIEVEVRNYRATVSSAATLTVEVEPTIDSITPATGGTAGGTEVVIVGDNLDDATGVTFGGTPGTAFSVVDGDVHVTTPAKSAAAYNVVVLHPLGNITEVNGFTYS